MKHDDTVIDSCKGEESGENGAAVRDSGPPGTEVPTEMNGHTSVRDAGVTNRTTTAGLATTAPAGRSTPTGQTVDRVTK